MDDGNTPGREQINGRQIAFLAVLGIAGLAAIRWLVRHPEDARRIDLGILLGTQKCCLRISDGCRFIGDRFRYVADKAGTQFNDIRNSAQ
jgi:hypothetical protein